MANKKSASYLSPKRLLPPSKYKQYVEQQQKTRRAELLQKVEQGEKNLKRFQAQRKYATSRTGRFGSFLTRGIQRMQQPGSIVEVAGRALSQKSIPITSQNVQQEYPTMPRTLKGSSGGRVGRPRGTYDRRYASVGGVYMWRKLQAQKLREQRIELQRRYTITPRQQMAINQLAYQEQTQRQNPESKTIPNTYGNVPMQNIMDEINSAANTVA